MIGNYAVPRSEKEGLGEILNYIPFGTLALLFLFFKEESED
jgi:hypothetical protein